MSNTNSHNSQNEHEDIHVRTMQYNSPNIYEDGDQA